MVMARPEKAKPGCFSGFLRVLLCAGTGTSPPVHPSDHVTEPDETELVHSISKKDALVEDVAATPGLVARLMGLDSLPSTNFVMKGATPDSVPRSRSVNFVDYLLNFDLNQANNHRRVKTSASFREVPGIHRQQDLVAFHWDENVSQEHEAQCELRKLEMGLEESKQGKKQGKKQNKEVVRERVGVKERNQGKNKKISKLKNERRRVPSYSKHGKKIRKQSEDKDLSSVSPSSKSCSYRYSGGGGSGSCSSSCSPLPDKQKKEFVESSLKKKTRKQKSPKKIESDYNSENLSPVSVLDVNDCPSHYGINFLDGTSPLASKSKWKSSSLISLSDGIEDTGSNNKGRACANTDINREAEYYSELLLKLCTLIGKDIRELDCTTKHMYKYEDFEEICSVFEHKILDLLLHEVVHEVVELSC